MGLLEAVTETVSLKAALVIAAVSYAVFFIINKIQVRNRFNRLGGVRAAIIPNKLPFGLDFVRKSVHATMNHKNLEMWRGIFDNVHSWTAETRIMTRRILFTADPENIKALLATQFGDFGKGEPFHKEWEPFLGDSIFATDGHKWSTSRQLLRPSFNRERVSDLHTFEHHLDTFFRCMANGGPLNGENQPVDLNKISGKQIDISELLFRYTLDVATDFLLGQDVKSMTTPYEEFTDAFNEVQRVQNIITRTGPLAPLVPKRSYYRAIKVVEAFINKFIDSTLRKTDEELAAHSKGEKGYTFLNELAQFTRDRKVLRDQIMAVLLAGRDTTAATLSWTLYELGRHPEVVRRLRREIEEHVGWNRTPTYDDLKGMKYLQYIMNETLRLYPAVPFNVRLALRDATLPRGGGSDGSQPVAVLKDTPVGFSTMVMQRRPELYPPTTEKFRDPAIFSPERWFHWQPKPWQYVPWSGGARLCLGQQFALTEMGYVLTRLFQRFDRMQSFMDEIDGGNPTLKAEIVLQPADGVRVAFWEAKNNS